MVSDTAMVMTDSTVAIVEVPMMADTTVAAVPRVYKNRAPVKKSTVKKSACKKINCKDPKETTGKKPPVVVDDVVMEAPPAEEDEAATANAMETFL
jgi:hypothetical protein